MTKKIIIALVAAFIAASFLPKFENNKRVISTTTRFDGERAFEDVKVQLSLGPRNHGSGGYTSAINWMLDNLINLGWQTEMQTGIAMGHQIHNVIAKRGVGDPWIILGAHYDTRMRADRDKNPKNWHLPVPGANDGASGVALLLEMARVIPEDLPLEVWLVFFDAEDNGNIEGWDWILGSSIFVSELDVYPDKMVLVDMVGDEDLNIYMEKFSDPFLSQKIWGIAADLGYSNFFIPKTKYRIIDDHLPFVKAGIPSVNIIDYDYLYWHTTEDTIDKISPTSLKIVGDTLLTWLMTFTP